MRLLDKILPQRFFLIVALLSGIVYNITTPPLQAPDEHDHFRRVYHISEGHYLPEKRDDRLGGDIPKAFNEFFLPYRLTATNLKYTVEKGTISNSFEIYYNEKDVAFEDFPNTSYYSFVSYLPQVIALKLTKPFNVSVGFLYYFGRIFIFLVWIISLYYFIKLIPVYKWLFTLVALLPMNVFLANSYSADTVTNIVSFLFIGCILRYALDERSFTYKRLLILICIVVLLALSKVVYVGLAFGFFIIPTSKFKNRKQYFLFAAILLAVTFIAAKTWSGVVMSNYTTYADYNSSCRDLGCISHCADYYKQKAYILEHPAYFPKVILKSLFEHPYTYLNSYIGNFGNSDVPLSKPLVILSYILILIVALTEKNKYSLSVKQKFILIGSAFFAFILLLLSQHLTWDCVGEGIVDLVQGRYLIPLFPLVFILFGGFLNRFSVSSQLITIIIVVFLFCFTSKALYGRYFVESYSEKLEFECGAEIINENGLFTTSNPSVTLEGVVCKNDSVARTGKSSALLSPASPFCFAYKFKNLKYGDLIEMSAWQKGDGAQMIVSGKGKNCSEFYLPYLNIAYVGKDNWKKMHYVLTFNQKCFSEDSTQVSFFMWNPTNSKTYIDDIKFCIKKYDKNYLDN